MNKPQCPSTLPSALLLASPAFPIKEVKDQPGRSEEHTSELQSPCNLVCRLLLEKKKTKRSHVEEAAHYMRHSERMHTLHHSVQLPWIQNFQTRSVRVRLLIRRKNYSQS